MPILGDDSMGFYCVYGAKASPTGGVEYNVCIYLFELTGGEVLLFGSGYGNIPGANLFDAAYDMQRVDQVLRFCMGKDPATTPIRILAPHGHANHINPACNRELENMGWRIVEIAFHPGDFGLINNMAWTNADRALFHILPQGSTCMEVLATYNSPLGHMWVFSRPGHTDGSIDLVIDTLNDVNNRFVVRGSQPNSPCAPLPGQREIIDAHGNIQKFAVPPGLTDVTPLSGSALGGTTLTLTGSNFFADGAGAARVLVNGVPATNVVVSSDTSLTCKTPPGPGGQLVDVAVIDNNGKGSYPGTFLYNAVPTLTSILPTTGDWHGGTIVQVRGSGFLLTSGVDDISFGASRRRTSRSERLPAHLRRARGDARDHGRPHAAQPERPGPAPQRLPLQHRPPAHERRAVARLRPGRDDRLALGPRLHRERRDADGHVRRSADRPRDAAVRHHRAGGGPAGPGRSSTSCSRTAAAAPPSTASATTPSRTSPRSRPPPGATPAGRRSH